jgi:hypothetical protein
MLKFFTSKAPSSSVAIAKSVMVGICFHSLLLSSVFAAGYILPNGTILYDDTNDHTFYKIDKMTPVPAPTMPSSSATTPSYAPVQTTRVIIEDRVVTYDRPVYIRERVIERGPVYDIVDVAGTVLFFGLLYDAAAHGFYRHDSHVRHHDRYDHYRR